MRFVKGKGKTVVVGVLSAVFIALMIHIVFASGVVSYVANIAGIPVGGTHSTVTTTVPPNAKIVKVEQAGKEVINFIRVKVTDSSAVLNSDGLITGFKVSIYVKAPYAVTVEVYVSVKLASGETVDASNTYAVNPGSNTVTINLPNPVNPDDVTSVSINAEPK